MTQKPRYRRHADGSTSRIADSLTNVVANLGTSRDKMSGSTYAPPMLGQMEMVNAYRGAWLPRKIVDIPAFDSCRAWRTWQGQPEQATAVDAEEKRLGVKGKVLACRIEARLLGGAALLIGTGDADPSKPLKPDALRAGGIRYLTRLHMRQLSAMDICRDPASEYFDRPEMWMLNGVDGMGVNIHASRLVIFTGTTVLDHGLMPAQLGWGDSVLQSVYQAVTAADSVAANIASLVFEAKVDTVGIPDLMNKLGNPAYEATLLKRWALAETGKGINGTLMHDAEELLGQKQAGFASLPDVLDRFMQLASGAADIPMTRLMGQSPAGMSATGESDIRNYYDRISSIQELEMAPAMAVLDECLIRSALGSRPAEVSYRWKSLWQSTERERFEIGKLGADIVSAMRGVDLIPSEPLAEAAVAMLTESGIMPGLQASVDEYFAEHPDEEAGAEAGSEGVDPLAEAGVMETEVGATDSAPRTLYVRRDVLNAAEIIAWAKEQGFKTTLPATDLHVTVTYSRQPVDWFKMGEAWLSEVKIAAGGPRQMEQFGQARVLLIASSELSWRHAAMVELGASWDHPEYRPHITISYDPDSPDLATVTPYAGEIVLGPEIFEEVKEDWKAGVTEE